MSDTPVRRADQTHVLLHTFLVAFTLLAICVLAVYFYRRATRHAESFATITGKGYMPTRIKLVSSSGR